MKKILSFLSLFGSLSTLLCCALPVTMVALGMGASFASLTTMFPQIAWLGMHKNTLFVGTGIALMLSYFFIRQSKTQACPTDRDQREVCQEGRSLSKYFFWLSVCIYFVGITFSYIIPRLIYGITS
ncbi:MAG: hypothetical protein KDD52_04000 [Bdellovibrionales bacterium]|nr:hypothetical protein [Bdellovibrionales bacterium]